MPKVVLHTPMRFKPIGGSEHAQELEINELEKLRDGKGKISTRCNTAAKFQQSPFFVIPIAYLSTPCFGGLLEAPAKSSFWLRNGRYQDLTRVSIWVSPQFLLFAIPRNPSSSGGCG